MSDKAIQVGDLVENVLDPDLDWRRVSRIEGRELWLAFGNGEIGPLPVANYVVVDR